MLKHHFIKACLAAVVGVPMLLCAGEKSKTIGDPYGISSGVFGWRSKTAEQELAMMESQGIGNLRLGVHWNNTVSPHFVWVWKNYDHSVPLLRKSKVKTCWHFGGSVPREGGPVRERHIPQFLDFITKVLQRHPNQAASFEILNETDLAGIPPGEFAKIFNAIADHLRKIEPDVPIVYGGNSGIPLEYIDKAFKAGVAEKMDVMTCHPYSWHNTPEISLRSGIRKLRNLMDKHGAGDKPLWITEIGYSSEPPIDFVQKVFPLLLQEMDLSMQDVRIILIHDPEYGYYSETHSAPLRKWVPGLKKVSYITFKDLEGLNPMETDLLVLSNSGYYPMKYYNAMEQYLKKGGKVFSLGSMPFSADMVKEPDGFVRIDSKGRSHLKRLHINWDTAWTTKGVPGKQKAWQWAAGFEGNTLPKYHSTYYYLSDTNLKSGDRLVPILYGVSDSFKGVSAGVYHFNSDLKGKFAFCGWTWRGCSELDQARLFPRMFIMLLSENVDKVFVHHFVSTGNAAAEIEGYFGILQPDMTRKPASYAYEALTRQLPPGSTRPLLSKKGDCYRARWTRPDGRQCTAFWRESYRTARLNINVKGACTIFDYTGKELKKFPNGGRISLAVGPGVIYIQHKGSIFW